ncbi:hypothetical protein [Pontibacter sp. SGAir0037]|uniref:hypothetical protein n=1 Tax=Pontibacter sp. SGAir0037 TaxID=2571030 RepID=UPI0010CCF7EA|nr:hypothetical protein [Pontibacter sp. SGAir0037]QCR22362.1 hypothetical protein C1N53_08430 [Pontibacter sp. SGAir0037]
MPEKNHQNDTVDQKNPLEWTVFSISLLLVLGVLGYWAYRVYKYEELPPELYVEKIPAPSEQTPYRYQVSVFNGGGQTAENTTIEVVLERDGVELDKAELEIPYLPKGSKREGWVLFREDPAKADTMIARVISYKKP